MLLSLKGEKCSVKRVFTNPENYSNISIFGTQTKLQLRQGTENSGLLFTLLKYNDNTCFYIRLYYSHHYN